MTKHRVEFFPRKRITTPHGCDERTSAKKTVAAAGTKQLPTEQDAGVPCSPDVCTCQHGEKSNPNASVKPGVSKKGGEVCRWYLGVAYIQRRTENKRDFTTTVRTSKSFSSLPPTGEVTAASASEVGVHVYTGETGTPPRDALRPMPRR